MVTAEIEPSMMLAKFSNVAKQNRLNILYLPPREFVCEQPSGHAMFVRDFKSVACKFPAL